MVSNNTRVMRAREEAQAKKMQGGDGEQDKSTKLRTDATDADMECEDMRDQGFSRGRVVILCAYRSIAYEVVQQLLKLCPNAKQVFNKQKFEKEYSPGYNDAEEGDGKNKSKKKKKADKENDGAIPDDLGRSDAEHVTRGNADDKFRFGLSIARKAVKLYTPFYDSDILICSPLGLKMTIGEQDAEILTGEDKSKESDAGAEDDEDGEEASASAAKDAKKFRGKEYQEV